MPGPGVAEGDGSASLFFGSDEDSLIIVTGVWASPQAETA